MSLKTQNKDQNDLRKQLWIGVYIAYVGSASMTHKNLAKEYADSALKAFDERFTNQTK